MLNTYLLLAAAVILACVLFNKITFKIGVPMLLAFILLGMCFGSDGLVKIAFNDYSFAEQICSIALIFIMFYGGFGTKWAFAKPVAGKAVLLSSVGTVLTAALVGLFCYFALKIALLESFLIGAVISSTDAASVFSILRSKRLNLKYNTASLLELESGSNDPFSYMLTVIVLSLMQGRVQGAAVIAMLFRQLLFGIVFGVGVALLARLIFKKFRFSAAGFDGIFLVAVAIVSYAAPAVLGGNGYLSAYIAGIILGNSRIQNKQALVHFFDGMTGLMQMLLFFLLGLLATPSRLPAVAPTALAIALFLTLIARPAAVFALLAPAKERLHQALLVSLAGMRGAASIVFAIMVVINPAVLYHDVFHIVFFIVLFSILVQGSLLPFAARKLDMTDAEADVLKTFNDYTDEAPVQFVELTIPAAHAWANKELRQIALPPESLIVLLLRGEEKLVPNGRTLLLPGDTLILSGRATGRIEGVRLYEKTVDADSDFAGKKIAALPCGDALVIMIRRGKNVLIPKGSTVVKAGDVLVINETKEQ